jgi:hypothetical protein
MKLLLSISLFLISLTLHAPSKEVITGWRFVSFEIDSGKIITKHGIYLYDKLPNLFLVYERRRGMNYEILLKRFESKTKKWH